MIGADSEQLGVMTPEEALEKAREADLDLVEVAPNSRPPVCRIMDYGRYKYEQKKKRAKGRQAHTATLKEVKLRPGTDMHDLEFKLNNARRFLIDGDKVKVTVMFRGREMVHTYRGREQLKQVLEQLGPIAKLENPPRMEGRFLSMILVGEREAVAEAKRQEAAEKAAAAAEAEAEAGTEGESEKATEAGTEGESEKAAEAEPKKEKEEDKRESEESAEEPETVLASESPEA